MGKRLDDEEAPCSECGGTLKFYPQPGFESEKLEAFCQKCSGIRHKDPGKPVSLKREDITDYKKRLTEKEKIDEKVR